MMGVTHNNVAFHILVKADVNGIHAIIKEKFNKELMKK